MKVGEPDCTFGEHPSTETVEYKGEKYKVVDVCVFYDNGDKELIRIGPYCLEEEMSIDAGGFGNINNELDDEISYYASDDDGVYYCLEMATGENID